MQYTFLSQRGLLALSGEDVIPFLQGLITNDATHLKDGKALYAALLSPQGKFLHDFFLWPEGDKILLDCEKARMDDLKKRLSMYKLRSKVTIETLPESMGVVAMWDSGKSEKGFIDPRMPELGYRIIGEVDAMLNWCGTQGWRHVDELAYDRMRLMFGVPDGSRDLEVDRAIIMHYGFEDLHGVDFKKGCYVGQEVIARTKYRGQVKKFLYQVNAEGGMLPQSGTPVYLGEVQAGELHTVSGDIGLAVLKVEDVEKVQAAQGTFRAGDIKLSASLPPWVTQKPVALAKEQ